MTPRQPYLIRALYDWILDNDATPYILVRVDDRTSVPVDFVRDGQIVLNISPTAVRDLAIDDDWLGFDGRFSGQSFSVLVPVNCVCAIYARETGEGMIFDGDLKDGGRGSEAAPARSAPAHGRDETVEGFTGDDRAGDGEQSVPEQESAASNGCKIAPAIQFLPGSSDQACRPPARIAAVRMASMVGKEGQKG